MRRILPALLCATLAISLDGCGGATGARPPEATVAAPDLDADPMALLPSDPIYVAKVDLRPLFSTGPLGDKLVAPIVHALPAGMESTFVANRDLDGVLVGSYAMDHLELLSVATGRFDPKAIDKALAPKIGVGPHDLKAVPFGPRTLYVNEKGAFVLLSRKTLLLGTEATVRAALTRIDSGKVTRDIPPWMAKAMVQPGGTVAVAASFEKQPVAISSIGPIPLSWLKSMKQLQVEGGLSGTGLKVKSALSFGDGAQAKSASQGLTTLGAMASMLGSRVTGGFSLDGLQVLPVASDVNVSFDLSTATLIHLADAVSEAAGGVQ